MRTLLIALICVIIPCHIWAQDMLGEGAIIDKGNNLDENTQALADVAAAGAADPVKRKVDRIVFDAQTIVSHCFPSPTSPTENIREPPK